MKRQCPLRYGLCKRAQGVSDSLLISSQLPTYDIRIFGSGRDSHLRINCVHADMASVRGLTKRQFAANLDIDVLRTL